MNYPIGDFGCEEELSSVPPAPGVELSKENKPPKTHIGLCFSTAPRAGWISQPMPDHLTPHQAIPLTWPISVIDYFGFHLSPCFISQVVQSPSRMS